MGIFKKLLGTEKVIDSVGGIIDDLVTTKEEKIQAKTKLKEIMNSYKIELEKNITARWQADANGNMLTRSVRPLVLIFLIIYRSQYLGVDIHQNLDRILFLRSQPLLAQSPYSKAHCRYAFSSARTRL